MIVWGSLRTLRNSPEREVGLEVPNQGWVTFNLTTDPFPPIPSGTVQLILRTKNNQGAAVDLGPSLPFSFGSSGSEATLSSGAAVYFPGKSGYQIGVQFPTPGNYWLAFNVPGEQKARFQIYVKPAQ